MSATAGSCLCSPHAERMQRRFQIWQWCATNMLTETSSAPTQPCSALHTSGKPRLTDIVPASVELKQRDMQRRCAPCVGVDVPIKHVGGCGISHGAVGNELHARVVRLDGKIEGDVIAYVGWVSTILFSTQSSHPLLIISKSSEAVNYAIIPALPGCHASHRLRLAQEHILW